MSVLPCVGDISTGINTLLGCIGGAGVVAAGVVVGSWASRRRPHACKECQRREELYLSERDRRVRAVSDAEIVDRFARPGDR